MAFQETDSSVRTSMSAWIIHTIVTKMRYVPIFLAHSNVFVVLATKEMAPIIYNKLVEVVSF